MNEKGIIDCPWLMIFSIFLKKTRNLLLLLSFISSDKILANGFLFVLSLTCLSLSVLAKRCRKRRAKSSNVFTLIGHGARWEGGDEIGSFHAFNHSRHIRQRQRRERVEFVSTQQKKKAGKFVWLSNFEKILKRKIRGLWHNAENSLFSVNLRAKKCEIISSGRGHGAGWGGGLLGGGEGRGVLVPKI